MSRSDYEKEHGPPVKSMQATPSSHAVSDRAQDSQGNVQPQQGRETATTPEHFESALPMAPPAADRQESGASGGDFGMTGLMDRELMLQASPIVKKVILNPKTYLFFDYALSELKFRGDIGDFIVDAVEDFWKSRGYRIVIEKKSEVGF
jgi:hypothetical protein